MTLEQAISYAIQHEGLQIITEERFVNYLNDLQAFTAPALKRIIATMIDEGYSKQLLPCLGSSGNQELEFNKVKTHLVNDEGFQDGLVEYVLLCLQNAVSQKGDAPTLPNNKVEASKMTKLNIEYFEQNDMMELFYQFKALVNDLYNFIDRLSRNAEFDSWVEHLDRMHITLEHADFSGDGDTSTYRGKLYFMALMDTYWLLRDSRVLKKYRLDFAPPVYGFMLLICKIYMTSEVSYPLVDSMEPTYLAFLDMLQESEGRLPTYSREFVYAQLLYDFEDMNLYHEYLNLIARHISLMRAALYDNSKMTRRIDKFVNNLNKRLF